MKTVRLTLVGRNYCSLCEKMRDAVLDASRSSGILLTLDNLDLDEHPSYELAYGELVPVLLLGDIKNGVEICHYHFDESAWRAALGDVTTLA
jgi:hypothetical protein